MNCWELLVKNLNIDISKSPDLEGLDSLYGDIDEFHLVDHMHEVDKYALEVDSYVDADFCVLRSGKHLGFGILHGNYITYLSPNGTEATQPIFRMGRSIYKLYKINPKSKISRVR